eukprot:TRINITY_DN20353_c0_g1_i1.p2 TRINITY_DN20353_c0_g1~~TRINITY_DN20353_c0_g1_i1.p2  ORF type:complete len:166 (+),score=21.40 TRINITY_DN20353_c0_g1_i1:264-761(+)
MGAVFSVVLAIGLPVGGGTAFGIWSSDKIKTWYPKLKKPSWNPPNWIFAPVWTTLYSMMGVASWLVYHVKGWAPLQISLYTVQLAFNFAWNPLFFIYNKLGVALVDIMCMFVSALATAISFGQVSAAAGWLMAPYLGWILFATALNYRLWKDNPNADKLVEEKLQ